MTPPDRTNSLTVLSIVRRPWQRPLGGVLWLRLVFIIARRLPPSKVRRMSFIHFARFVIIRRFPPHGQRRDIRRHLLLFESNYNGSFDQYIDGFSDRIPRKMRAFWGTSSGFDDVKPVGQFKRYIKDHQYEVCHLYVAYPETTAVIESALRIAEPLADFRRRASRLKPDRFGREFRSFLTTVQGDL